MKIVEGAIGGIRTCVVVDSTLQSKVVELPRPVSPLLKGHLQSAVLMATYGYLSSRRVWGPTLDLVPDGS